MIESNLSNGREKRAAIALNGPSSPSLDNKATNFMYCLYEEEGGLALYANSASGRFFETPVHNHKTWAIMAGVEGSELNKLFARSDDGDIREIGQEALMLGNQSAFDAEGLHAIRIKAPLLNFHPHLYKSVPGTVYRELADYHVGGKARVILATVRGKQDLRSLEFACRMLAHTQHGSKRLLLGLLKFDSIA